MPENVVRKVVRRIRELRQKRGWSQEKLAEEANPNRTYIGQVERGEASTAWVLASARLTPVSNGP
jgi:ribosome-binding protein aMBF1 (putative translation factor)